MPRAMKSSEALPGSGAATADSVSAGRALAVEPKSRELKSALTWEPVEALRRKLTAVPPVASASKPEPRPREKVELPDVAPRKAKVPSAWSLPLVKVLSVL